MNEIGKAFFDALWGLLTPTEAAAVAVIYSFIVGAFIYKELTLKTFWEALFSTGKTTGIILLIIMNAGIFHGY